MFKRFSSRTIALVGLLSLGAVGATTLGVSHYTQKADDCCYPGSPCCHPGAPCCMRRHRAG